jgi:hypothetical protein
MPGVVSHLLKRSGMISNLLRRWQIDFATLKGRGMVLGLFEKKQDAILPHCAPPQALVIIMMIA